MKNNTTTNEIENKMNEYLEQIEYSSRNYFNANEPNIMANDGLYSFIIDYIKWWHRNKHSKRIYK